MIVQRRSTFQNDSSCSQLGLASIIWMHHFVVIIKRINEEFILKVDINVGMNKWSKYFSCQSIGKHISTQYKKKNVKCAW